MGATPHNAATLGEVIGAHVSESYCPSEIIADSVRRWIRDEIERMRMPASKYLSAADRQYIATLNNHLDEVMGRLGV